MIFPRYKHHFIAGIVYNAVYADMGANISIMLDKSDNIGGIDEIKSLLEFDFHFYKLVVPAGLEPATNDLKGRCSTIELKHRNKKEYDYFL